MQRDTSLSVWQLTATLMCMPIFKMLNFSHLHGDRDFLKSLHATTCFRIVLFSGNIHFCIDGQPKHNQSSAFLLKTSCKCGPRQYNICSLSFVKVITFYKLLDQWFCDIFDSKNKLKKTLCILNRSKFHAKVR